MDWKPKPLDMVEIFNTVKSNSVSKCPGAYVGSEWYRILFPPNLEYVSVSEGMYSVDIFSPKWNDVELEFDVTKRAYKWSLTGTWYWLFLKS